MDMILSLLSVDFLGTALRLSIPIAFAALGGMISERSGIYNIGLEGMMLSGAFGAAAGAAMAGSPLVGILAAIALGGVMALLLAVLTITLKAEQIVCGIAINVLTLGLTSFLARVAFGAEGGLRNIPGFQRIEIPFLSDIPVIGPVFFAQDIMAYLLYLLVPVMLWLVYRSNPGLTLRAAGEHPIAVEASGRSVARIRFACVIASGILAGLGGAYLVLSEVFSFSENMTAGKGFVALAALILGRWNPLGAVLAATLFGVFDALQLRMQFENPEIPYQAFIALPYIVALVALVALQGKALAPRALGKPFTKEAR